MNILVTNFQDRGDDVMIFSETLTANEVEKRLTAKGEYFDDVIVVPDNDVQYYCYEPCYL